MGEGREEQAEGGKQRAAKGSQQPAASRVQPPEGNRHWLVLSSQSSVLSRQFCQFSVISHQQGPRTMDQGLSTTHHGEPVKGGEGREIRRYLALLASLFTER